MNPEQPKRGLDVGAAISFPFNIPDWASRTAIFFGAVIIFLVVISIISAIPMIIVPFVPTIGIVLYILSIILIVILSVLFTCYQNGYMKDIAEAVKLGEDVMTIKLLANYSQRTVDGFKIGVANFIYMLPGFLIWLVGFVVYMLAVLPELQTMISSIQEGNIYYQYEPTIDTGVAIFYLVTSLIYLGYALIISFLVTPAIWARYINTNSLSAALSLSGIAKFISKNLVNLIIYGAVLILMVIAFSIIFFMSYLTIFICIGIVLIPLVASVGSMYFIHFQAHMIGQLAREDE